MRSSLNYSYNRQVPCQFVLFLHGNKSVPKARDTVYHLPTTLPTKERVPSEGRDVETVFVLILGSYVVDWITLNGGLGRRRETELAIFTLVVGFIVGMDDSPLGQTYQIVNCISY